eukprot:353782_1
MKLGKQEAQEPEICDTPAPSGSITELADECECPVCSKKFPASFIEYHVNSCLNGEMTFGNYVTSNPPLLGVNLPNPEQPICDAFNSPLVDGLSPDVNYSFSTTSSLPPPLGLPPPTLLNDDLSGSMDTVSGSSM